MDPQPAPAPAGRPFSRVSPWLVVALAAAAVSAHRLWFAWVNTPNLLYWDQWDIYDPLFANEGWWKIFNHQHGPHRQGLGFLFTAGLARLTDWDSRGDALLTVGATVAAALLALPLARRCGARSVLALAGVPFVFLTMRQFEAWVGPANPSHGAFPLLLTMLLGLTWFVRAAPWRLAVQVLLTLCLVFTGFGLFAGALSPLLLGIETWRHLRAGERGAAAMAGAACLLGVGVWVLFFHGYGNQPAVDGFRFPYERPLEYAGFSTLMFASFFGWHGRPVFDVAAGAVLMFLLAAVAVVNGWRVLRASPARAPASAVLFLLSAATLLYCVNTAVGRVMLGWREAPYAPRYVTLLVPGIFALFLQIELVAATWWRRSCRLALLALVGWSGFMLTPGDRDAADWYRRGRAKWKETYLATGSQRQADAATSPDQGFVAHPGDLTAKLEFLRRHRLNLFKPGQP